MPARPEALEAAILRDVESHPAYYEYADWLLAAGDPRGELIEISCALAQQQRLPDEALLRRRQRVLIAAEEARLFAADGVLEDDALTLEWHLGFVARALLVARGAGATSVVQSRLRALLADPVALILEEVQLSSELADGEVVDYQPVIDLLVERSPPSLRRLWLGNQPAPTDRLGDVSPLWAALPRLESLMLQGTARRLGPIASPSLTDFELRTPGLDRETARAIAGARWPGLRSLVVWLGRPAGGADAVTLEDLRPILDGVGLPSLRHLGLLGAPFADDLARALPAAPVLARLSSLDLSLGDLGDEGARALSTGAAALAHLRYFTAAETLLTEAGEALLVDLCPSVYTAGKRAR